MIDPMDIKMSADGRRYIIGVDPASPSGDHVEIQMYLMSNNGVLSMIPEGVLIVEDDELLEKP